MSMNASSPTPDVPLEIEPIVGWRVWVLTRGVLGDLRLRAIAHPHEWTPQEIEPAVCAAGYYRSNAHRSPVQHCSCGYYAADSVKSLASSRVFSNRVAVIGAIAMWGSVIQHAHGARSEFAYPARLRLVCGRCLEQGVATDPTVVLDGHELKPLCAKHAKSVRGDLLPADRVQAELLSTYAVDLLPMPSLPRFRTERANDARDFVSMVFGIGFMLLRVVIGGMIAMWLLGLALTALAIVVGAVEHVVFGADEPPPTPAVSVVSELPSVPLATRQWPRTAPHRGAPVPPPLPRITFPCGVGHGDSVELVGCGNPRADLIGMAQQERPHGMEHDCTSLDVAYSHGRDWWVCWFSLRDAWVHPWPDASNPFHSHGGVT